MEQPVRKRGPRQPDRPYPSTRSTRSRSHELLPGDPLFVAVQGIQGTMHEMQGSMHDMQGSMHDMQGTVHDLQGTMQVMQATMQGMQATAIEMQLAARETQAAMRDMQATSHDMQTKLARIDERTVAIIQRVDGLDDRLGRFEVNVDTRFNKVDELSTRLVTGSIRWMRASTK
jgi:methyl-accepting chemotaxis protein